MELPKTYQKRLSPALKNIIQKSCVELAKKDSRHLIYPKDLIMAILLEKDIFATIIIESFHIELESLIEEVEVIEISVAKTQDPKTFKLHESVLQVLRNADKTSIEMQEDLIMTEHIPLSFLRYSGTSKYILEIKKIFLKWGIGYESYFDGIIAGNSAANDIAEAEDYSHEEEAEDSESNGKSKNKGKNKSMSVDQIETTLIQQGAIKNLNSVCVKRKEKIVCRENEIDRLVEILTRKKKRNPIIVGESGVGKTTLVMGLVDKIIEQEVPSKIRNSEVIEVSLGSVVAGSKYRGQFEERMINILKFFESKEKDRNKIMFIDEIHHVIKAGSAEGSVDASAILKPKLSDDSLQCIGATTYDEYRKFLMADKAMARRFTPIFLEEPNVETTKEILMLVKGEYEEYHKVTVSEKQVEIIVNLANRYIKDKHFPDKAFDLLDESCAKMSMIKEDLKDFQDKDSIALLDSEIEKVVSKVSGVPITSLTLDEKESLKNLDDSISKSVVGQRLAIEAISNAIKRSRIGFKEEDKPIGVYLFLGPTGVGKTLLAKSLSKNVFGDDKIIRLDMSEYMEKYTVSKIIGSPPGYVGYDDGGQLTQMVKKKPYSVILLDEIEKAHKDVLNILLQIFDEGRLTDSQGQTISFKDCIIIMTSNLSVSKIDKIGNTMGFNKIDSIEENQDQIRKFLLKEAEKYFAPEFVNRLDEVVIFDKFSQEEIRKIMEIELGHSLDRIKGKGYALSVSEDAKDFIVKKGFDAKYGARPMKRAIATFLETPFAKLVFADEISAKDNVLVSSSEEGLIFEKKEN